MRHQLEAHVHALADEIGERHVRKPGSLRAAAEYIKHWLPETVEQTFRCDGQIVANIEREQPGASGETIVVGAHYDTVSGTPGANDNGTGVAAVLALAERFRETTPRRTIRWVLFVNEEPPYFQSDLMGSYVYAKRCRERGERIAGMISLETIGFYSDEPGSQTYPFPRGSYPDRGDFIGFVSDIESEPWLRTFADEFRTATDFPAEMLSAPSFIPGVGWSDHWSFWQFGYPALMVTDTAPWRYPHYHGATDTPDKIDYVRFAKVVEGVAGALS